MTKVVSESQIAALIGTLPDSSIELLETLPYACDDDKKDIIRNRTCFKRNISKKLTRYMSLTFFFKKPGGRASIILRDVTEAAFCEVQLRNTERSSDTRQNCLQHFRQISAESTTGAQKPYLVGVYTVV